MRDGPGTSRAFDEAVERAAAAEADLWRAVAFELVFTAEAGRTSSPG